MDGIQGAVLSVKLKYLERWNEARRNNAKLYNEFLSGTDGIILPKEEEYAKHVYHIFAVRVQNRDKLIEKLARKEINYGIHYPIPVHLTKAYEFLELGKGSFPIAEKIAEEFVSLPMYAELPKAHIEYVTSEIKHLIHERELIT